MRYTSEDIIEHVKALHSNQEDFESGDLISRIESCSYFTLEEVAITDIDDNEFASDDDLVKEYADKESSFPAIVLQKYGEGDFSIIDGTHRVKSAKLKGQLKMLAYIGIG